MLFNLSSFFSDPRNMLIAFLLAFPGRMLAISAHEFAHAWMANRCGDPTAKMLGRLTLNPLKHLDPIGFIMMILVGIGWAKPVPVNPRNYRKWRKDDLLVSIAGVTMNLILCLLGFLICAAMVFFIAKIKSSVATGAQVAALLGDFNEYGRYIFFFSGSRMLYYVYEMVALFVTVNLYLAIFNLIPIPPLDGYHVLNDLMLKRRLFASGQAARYAMTILYVLVFTGALSEGLGFVADNVFRGLGWAVQHLFALIP